MSTVPVGVHVLGQFEFCPRAGVIAYEEVLDDPGEEDSPQRLDYLPDYEERLIQTELDRRMRFFWCLSGLMAGGVYACWYVWDLTPELVILAMVPVALISYGWISVCAAIASLRRRLDCASTAVSKEPNPLDPKEEIFNWWEFRRSGFDVIRLPERMFDEELGVVGRPWRLLKKGNLLIPVFRKRCGDKSVHSNHRVRIAAYCAMIGNMTGAKAPYGLVLFSGGYEMMVIPATEDVRRVLTDVLRRTREVMASPKLRSAAEPASAVACAACPFGKPEPLSDVPTKKKPDQPLKVVSVLRGLSDRRRYYCTCGTRFGWTPPHQDCIDLGLAQTGMLTGTTSR